MDGHDLKDSLLKDAAEMQRQRGDLPTSEANDAEWSEQLRVYERSKSEDRPVIAKPVERQRAPGRKGSKELIEERGGAVLTPEQIAATERQRERKRRLANRKEQIESALALRRLKMLAKLPDWRAKVLKAWEDGQRLAIANPGTDPSAMSGAFVGRVLDESSAMFGPWDRLPERKIKVTVK